MVRPIRTPGCAAGWNGDGGGSDNTTYAYAICSGDGIDISGVTATVQLSEVPGPTVSTTGQTATINCPSADGTLTGGGAAISGGNATTRDFNQASPGSQGDHLNGSFPSDSSGNPVSDGTPTAASWTAFTHTGGQNSPNTFTDVLACRGNTPILDQRATRLSGCAPDSADEGKRSELAGRRERMDGDECSIGGRPGSHWP